MAFQPCHRTVRSKHVGYDGSRRLRLFPVLRMYRLCHVRVCLVLGSGDEGELFRLKPSISSGLLLGRTWLTVLPQGMSLERMDDLFGVTELVKQIEDEERAQSTSEGKEAKTAEIKEIK